MRAVRLGAIRTPDSGDAPTRRSVRLRQPPTGTAFSDEWTGQAAAADCLDQLVDNRGLHPLHYSMGIATPHEATAQVRVPMVLTRKGTPVPAPDSISRDKLQKLIGTPRCPVLIDVRTDADFAADTLLLPAARRIAEASVSVDALPGLAAGLAGRPAVVVCQHGHRLSQGVAAWLRHEGVPAEYLDDGFAGWRSAGLPVFDPEKLPACDGAGRSLWVTRARPKIDRIACPWLIRRFLDPHAVLLFVAPPEVQAVAERFGAAPFDLEGVFWSHRGELCTFDVMLAEFGLRIEALDRLARIVRGADTARPDLAPEAAGLLAASLGLSRMYSDDLEQLAAGMTLYDALYRWARDATDETHNWPSPPRRA